MSNPSCLSCHEKTYERRLPASSWQTTSANSLSCQQGMPTCSMHADCSRFVSPLVAQVQESGWQSHTPGYSHSGPEYNMPKPVQHCQLSVMACTLPLNVHRTVVCGARWTLSKILIVVGESFTLTLFICTCSGRYLPEVHVMLVPLSLLICKGNLAARAPTFVTLGSASSPNTLFAIAWQIGGPRGQGSGFEHTV